MTYLTRSHLILIHVRNSPYPLAPPTRPGSRQPPAPWSARARPPRDADAADRCGDPGERLEALGGHLPPAAARRPTTC